MEAEPNVPHAPGMDREERRSSSAPDKRPIGALPHKTGMGLEEDWTSLGTDDPAFWLKESDQE